MDFFKGYVETKNKKCIEKIRGRNDFKNYEQVKLLPEFAGVLAEDTILIDIDDFEQSEILFKIVKDLKLGCRVYKTTRGKHFLFKNKLINSCKTHSKVAVGLTTDIKVGTKNSYEVLKFNGKEREILYDTEELLNETISGFNPEQKQQWDNFMKQIVLRYIAFVLYQLLIMKILSEKI